MQHTQQPVAFYTAQDHTRFLDGGDKEYVLKVRDLPRDEKPREKLMMYGSQVLSVHELLAVVLGVGTRKEEVLAMAKRAIKEYGEQTLVYETDSVRLAEALDIPVSKACQMVAAFELGRRFFKEQNGKMQIVRTPKQVYEYMHDMRDLPKEHLRGLYLDAHYRIIHDEIISIGSVTTNIVHPREVFRPAIECSASAVILAHNHPSGIVDPSDADVEVTKQLVSAGKMLGIDLLDHIVITKDTFRSIITS